MMDKTRVKDLAVDLKMQPKDLLALIKDLHIQAKASTSLLADEEIARIKDRIQQTSAAERRENTDVIVRRRRKAEPEEATAGLNAEPDGLEKSPEAEGAAKAPESDAASGAEPEKAAAKEAEKAAEAPTAARSARAGRPAETAGARVISRPAGAARKDDSEAKTQARAEPGKTPLGKGDDRRPSQANLSAEPEKSADGSTVSSTPQFAESAQTERQEPAGLPQSTGVRVISRPSAEQKPTRPAGGDRRPSGARPGGAQPGRPGYQRPADGAKSGGRSDARGDGRQDARGDRAPGRFAGPDTRAAGQMPAENAESEGRGKKRGKGKRTVDFSDEKRFRGDGDEGWTRAGSGRKSKTRKAQKPEVKQVSQPIKAAKRKIRMEEFIRVADLAHQIGLKAGEIIKILFNLGIMATINQSLDVDTATLVAAEFSYEVERVGFSEDEFVSDQSDDPAKMVARPPVVTIMGHVDHGKTSLLDAIRKTSVTSGEAGGITQHIGAYHVNTKKGDIVFLDTPGHEAFTAMRARGAEVTDIVVLVVAADDGVMEQTREAINHARAAHVPIMVAVNKMDKAEANPDRVKRELAELGMVPEEWGGDVTFSYVSAKTRAGLDDFLELLALQAEILELKANPDKAARGHIVEAKLDKGRGALGTVLIQQGTLRVGDPFVSGVHNGRVRAMFDDQGKKVGEAGPSMPVEVQGFEGVPEAGEEFIVIADEKTARRIAETRAQKQRERELAKESRITLETFLSSRADAEEAQVLNLVVKADVHGSLEAIKEQLKKLSGDKVRINLVHGGTGAVSESDVLLAAASAAIIIGFNVRPNQKTKDLAEQEKVDIRFYDIIYKLTEEITGAMEGMLSPVEKEVSIGTADVRETFSVPKVGIIAGCMVSDGKITRNSKVRLLRDGVVIHTGSISSLRRFKDDAREVVKGYECGIGLENYNDLKVGDVIEAFEIVEEAAKL